MLSPRLQLIFDRIEAGAVVADIGTDHGYLATELIKTGKSPQVIASDINVKPLEKAQKRIDSLGFSSRAETRLGPGMTVLKPGECHTVVIAGMGGYMIRDIITASRDLIGDDTTLILQPMNNSATLRRFLEKAQLTIAHEDLVQEETKIYEVLTVKPGCMTVDKSVDYYLGRQSVRQHNDLFKAFLERKIIATQKTILQVQNKNTQGAMAQMEKSVAFLHALQEVRDGLKSE